VLRQIERAFADPPRPADDELLHPDARDDNDIKSLYGVTRWRDLSDEAVEYEYAALFFLGPAGFRHFLPRTCPLPFVIGTAAPRWSARRSTR